jgi:tubulin-folding cofactor B
VSDDIPTLNLGLIVSSVQGEQYFTCLPKYGVFVRGDKVRAGDYPVEEINFEEEM